MDITIVRNNRLDRTKFVISHVTIEQGDKISDVLSKLGIEEENVVIFIGKHDQVLNYDIVGTKTDNHCDCPGFTSEYVGNDGLYYCSKCNKLGPGLA